MSLSKALFLGWFLAPFLCVAQNAVSDTSKALNEVEVTAYFGKGDLYRQSASIATVRTKSWQTYQSNASLVPVLNTVPGVRMEERSPGSYRLSIRGSLLRSPFGVRNVKIYVDEFPLTDAGGNTYLNLVDVAAIDGAEVIKGPDGSVFGANTGGVVLLKTNNKYKTGVAGAVTAGSYGLFREDISASSKGNRYGLQATQAYQRSAGYRLNSAMNREYYQLSQHVDCSAKTSLRSLIIFSDLSYRTPGGLTLSQVEANPKAARPSVGKIPGALEQNAGIYNKTLFTGLSGELKLDSSTRIVTALSTMFTGFRNPFITNYEVRGEKSLGLRLYLDRVFKVGQADGKAVLGVETQQTGSSIDNYGNRAGVRDTLQSADDLTAGQSFVFAYLRFSAAGKFSIDLANSVNLYRYSYESGFPYLTSRRNRKFDPQWMPKLGIGYPVTEGLFWRATMARGYSAPTIAEVRSSDKQINTVLQAESGWNYETGLRYTLGSLYADAAIFNFDLDHAIVRRVNVNDAEYFVNAGGTRQTGFELWVNKEVFGNGIIDWLTLTASFTWSRFRFRDYSNAAADYSGNRLTGVPSRTWMLSAHNVFPRNYEALLRYYYNSAIPLNDANSVYSRSSHVVQGQVGRAFNLGRYVKRKMLTINIGVDNLFDVRYSLGNDLNAAGNRYYNPAPGRNFYASVRLLR